MFALLSTVAFATSPTADPSPTCLAAAKAAYPNASVQVLEDGVEILASTNDLAAVFSAVASADSASDLSVVRNSDGTLALRQAIDCVFDAEAMTWAAVRLNQQFPALRVRADGLKVTRNGNSIVLDEVALQGGSSTPTITFFSTLGPLQACLRAGFRGVARVSSNDIWWSVAVAPVPGQTCQGHHCRECNYEEDGWGCMPCEKPDPQGAEDSSCTHSSTTTDPVFGSAEVLSWSF